MANTDSRGGLKPLRYLSGAPWTGAATLYNVASGYGTALFIGDAVDLAGANDATGKYPTVQIGTLTDGGFTIGPIVAIQANPSKSLERVYLPATTGGYVWVADDPNLIFEAQLDSGTSVAATSFPGNTILVTTHSGSTDTGISGMELDSSGLTNNSSNLMLVTRIVDRADNELAEHAKVECMISMHRYRSTGGGDGLLGIS